ncbi:hypothetical protein [Roseibacillus persicicus]|uniref:hypothetical protein n=1 Tax=Roseibacillus persicicus TaxID=454148 RepID=UPI0028127672|nr:hypothetical protein [Roseibacillus persicicus]
MTARIEKNRRHLATVAAASIGSVIFLLLADVFALSSKESIFYTVFATSILLARTLVVEAGVRRRTSAWEKSLDKKASEALEKHIGVEVKRAKTPQ